jgi:hypothetical protein
MREGTEVCGEEGAVEMARSLLNLQAAERTDAHMKKTIFVLGLLLMSVAPRADAQVSVGIQIGAPPPPPNVVVMRAPAPGSSYVWVEGYWYPKGRHYRWRDGYWAQTPYAGAYWVRPRHVGGRYYGGFWGRQGDHRGDRWNRSDDRSHDRGRGRGDDRRDGRRGRR